MVWSTPDAYGYEITLDAVLDIDETEGYVLVDNFKIVHTTNEGKEKGR